MTKTNSGGLWQAALDSVAVGRLGPQPALEFRGPDARRFCNGLFTNNVRDMLRGQITRHAVADDRGRIGGFLTLICTADDAFVGIPEGISVADFQKRVEHYLVFDDVTVTPTSGSWCLLTLQGPQAREALQRLEPTLDGWVWPRVRSPFGGVDVLVSLETEDRLWSAVAARHAALTVSDLELLRVMAGQPEFPRDTGPAGLPHEMGLRDELLAFNKGCYLGQESLNRIDVMGDVKRGLVGVVGSGMPVDGAVVRVGDKKAGALSSVLERSGGRFIAIALVRKALCEPGAEIRVDHEGSKLHARVVSFPIPADLV